MRVVGPSGNRAMEADVLDRAQLGADLWEPSRSGRRGERHTGGDSLAARMRREMTIR